LDTFSDENIRRIKSLAQGVRVKHSAMEWGVPASHLIKKEGLDYDEYDLNNGKGLLARFKIITKKIKAAIFVREKVILVDNDLHPAKKPFGQAHELGHHTIPEHKEIFYVCSEHDLNPETRHEMEFEANLFAAELLIPEPLLDSIHKNYPISMHTIMHLANVSGASIHSSAIKYVQSSRAECCLLILKVGNDADGNEGLILKTHIPSEPWWNRHKIRFREFFPKDHDISAVVFSGNIDDVVTSTARIQENDFALHSFYNSYTVLSLLF
jgi:Zn-dependent peptidase ImmA (M78 family)